MDTKNNSHNYLASFLVGKYCIIKSKMNAAQLEPIHTMYPEKNLSMTACQRSRRIVLKNDKIVEQD